MQCSRRILSIEPSSSKSGTPTSMAGESASSAWSAVASIETIGGDFLRRRMSTMLNVSLCNHVEKTEPPRNALSLQKPGKTDPGFNSQPPTSNLTDQRKRTSTHHAWHQNNCSKPTAQP